MKITKEQLKFIFGDDWRFIEEKILTNCFCGAGCGDGNAVMVDWRARLNEFDDVVFDGKCAKCGRAICRSTETGENEEYLGRLEEIRVSKKK